MGNSVDWELDRAWREDITARLAKQLNIAYSTLTEKDNILLRQHNLDTRIANQAARLARVTPYEAQERILHMRLQWGQRSWVVTIARYLAMRDLYDALGIVAQGY